MKSLAVLLNLFLTITVFGQEKTVIFYYTKDGNVCDSINAAYIKYHYYTDTVNGSCTEKISNAKGQIQSLCEYSNINLFKREGISTYYHENGNIKSQAKYADSKLNGEVTTFYASGQLKRKDYYENGNLVRGNCYSQSGEDTTYFSYEIMPEYPGGEKALLSFISTKVKYPKSAKRNNIFGKVMVEFIINEYGRVSETKISKSVHPLLDEEALRVVNLMKVWKPGKMDGEKVKVKYQIPINFELY